MQDAVFRDLLKVNRESLVILANSHDLNSLHPDNLYSKAIVPPTFPCQSFNTNNLEKTVTVHTGPIFWYLTGSQLWISTYPDLPVSEYGQLTLLAPETDLLQAGTLYVQEHPYCPITSFWMYWSLELSNPDPGKWIRDRFWPVGDVGLPLPSFAGQTFDINAFIGADPVYLRYTLRPSDTGVSFECYSYRMGLPVVRDRIKDEIASQNEHLETVVGIIETLDNFNKGEGNP